MDSEFSKGLIIGFSPAKFKDHAVTLEILKSCELRQTSTLREYQSRFERLANQNDGLPESFLVSCFVSGLKDETRLDVQLFIPWAVVTIIGQARL